MLTTAVVTCVEDESYRFAAGRILRIETPKGRPQVVEDESASEACPSVATFKKRDPGSPRMGCSTFCVVKL